MRSKVMKNTQLSVRHNMGNKMKKCIQLSVIYYMENKLMLKT